MNNHYLARAGALVLASLVITACGGPLGPIAGGTLSGQEYEGEEPNWDTLMADIENIQLESNPADPYSVNVWGAGHGDALYVPTSLILGSDNPVERDWVANVMQNPNVRLRIDGTIYSRSAIRVTDEAVIKDVRSHLMAKHGEDEDEHSDKAWIFRMDPR